MLAHQGGWDEMLLVAVPILVIAGLLAVATRRARRLHPEPDLAPPDDGEGCAVQARSIPAPSVASRPTRSS